MAFKRKTSYDAPLLAILQLPGPILSDAEWLDARDQFEYAAINSETFYDPLY
jgi:hypothetical protein